MQVTSVEFEQDVGRFQEAAQQAPVAISKDGRPHTVLISAAVFEMVVRGRVARRVEDLDEETIAAIARSEVSAEHAHLDELLKDWTP